MPYIFASICIVLLTGFTCYPKVTKNSLSGVIFDSLGTVYPNVDVSIKPVQKNISYSRQIRTTSDDSFIFRDLPQGKYQINVIFAATKTNIYRFVYLPKKGEVFLKIEIGNACEDMSEKNSKLSMKEKLEIINQSLIMTLKQYFNETEKISGIILSGDHIPFKQTEILPEYNIRKMSSADIQRKANEKGDLKYIYLSEFRITGNCIAVSTGYKWALKNNDQANLDGGGFVFEFRKYSGVWKNIIFSRWLF